MSTILGVKPGFFFEGLEGGPAASGPDTAGEGEARRIDGFATSREGLELNRAFSAISDPKVRRKLLLLVTALASEDAEAAPEGLMQD